MNALLRLLAVVFLAVALQPLMAHGGERHGEAKAAPGQNVPPSPALPDVRVGMQASPSEDASSAPSAESARPTMQHESEKPSIWTRLHPASVHFPIALLLGAALAEALAMTRRSSALADAARVMAWLGAGGAVIAAFLGWIHTGLWFGGDATMQWHRWTGMGLAVAAPLAAWLAGRADRRAFRILLFAIAAVVLAQGYWGGELAHGPNHLGL